MLKTIGRASLFGIQPVELPVAALGKLLLSLSHVRPNISIKVGNGVKTKFWSSRRAGYRPLCIKFLRVYALLTNKEN